MVEARPSLQDLALRKLITENIPVTVFLVNGLKLQGVIAETDHFSMLIVRGGAQLLVYKHVVATILPGVPVDLMENNDGIRSRAKRSRAVL